MNIVYVLPFDMQTSHDISTSTENHAEQEIISSEHLQVKDAIEQTEIYTSEDLRSKTSNENLHFIAEIPDSEICTLDNFSSNISNFEEELDQSQMINLEDSKSNTESDQSPQLKNDTSSQTPLYKLEDPWPNTIADKAAAKERHANLQQFIIDHSAHRNTTNPAAETIKASFQQGQQRKAAICIICHKSFVNHSKLNWHMRMHDNNRTRFQCPMESCGRLYASKQSCDLHYRQTHLDEGIFCPICHKIFSVKQTLEVHMRYHTKDFPYQCDNCDRKFAQKGHLTQHIGVKHQNLRYICTEPDCGKIFQNSVSLKNHRYTHSGMPFKCSHCTKEYPQKNKLRVHLIQKHNLDYTLDDLETMRQFQSIRTRHAYVKVQTMEVEQSVDGDSVDSLPLTSDCLEELDVGV